LRTPIHETARSLPGWHPARRFEAGKGRWPGEEVDEPRRRCQRLPAGRPAGREQGQLLRGVRQRPNNSMPCTGNSSLTCCKPSSPRAPVPPVASAGKPGRRPGAGEPRRFG